MNIYGALLITAALAVGGCGTLRQTPEEQQQVPDPNTENIVTAEDLEGTSARNVADALRGRVPGVHVYYTPNGGVGILLRGARSIQGKNTPLYVIDGVPALPSLNGEVPGISIYDIESIEVLKDLAATARYGVRGAHGVILIETKRPPAPEE